MFNQPIALNPLAENLFIVLQACLNSFADLVSAAEFRPELFVLLLPIRTETLVKVIAQFLKKQFPGRLALYMRSEKILQENIQFR